MGIGGELAGSGSQQQFRDESNTRRLTTEFFGTFSEMVHSRTPPPDESPYAF